MKVFYLSLKKEIPNNDYWDYGMIHDILSKIPNVEFIEASTLPKLDRAIVLLPARSHAGLEIEVNKQLSNIGHSVFFAMGDEEADFGIDLISANHIWVQNPHPDKHENYNKIGTGYPPHAKQYLTGDYKKNLDVFFSGQITHVRRHLMLKYAREYAVNNDAVINPTDGFTKGMNHADYYFRMQKAKIVLCPSGAVIPDSFRVFESLEAMAIPIADEVNPSGSICTYWDWLFQEATPFPKIHNWSEVESKINEVLKEYPTNLHKQTAWWILYKRNLKNKIVEQYNG